MQSCEQLRCERIHGWVSKVVSCVQAYCTQLFDCPGDSHSVGCSSSEQVVPAVAWAKSSHRTHQGLRLWERGVDRSLFNPRRRSLAGRLSMGISEAEPLLTLVGRAVWEQRLAVLLVWSEPGAVGNATASQYGPRDEVSEA